jgi:hypothetical protein
MEINKFKIILIWIDIDWSLTFFEGEWGLRPVKNLGSTQTLWLQLDNNDWRGANGQAAIVLHSQIGGAMNEIHCHWIVLV